MSVPFYTFDQYFPALACALNSDDYDVYYPAYGAYCEDIEGADANIIDHILALDSSELNVQKGLSGLLHTILQSSRCTEISLFQRPIQRLLDMGARFLMEDIHAILRPDPHCVWETQRCKIAIKASLLSFLHQTFDLPIPNCILDAELLDDETMEYNQCELESGREFIPTYLSFFHTYLEMA